MSIQSLQHNEPIVAEPRWVMSRTFARWVGDLVTAFNALTSFHEFLEITTPDAGAANTARLFCRDNGAGKTQLCVRFNTGAVQVLSTEP